MSSRKIPENHIPQWVQAPMPKLGDDRVRLVIENDGENTRMFASGGQLPFIFDMLTGAALQVARTMQHGEFEDEGVRFDESDL